MNIKDNLSDIKVEKYSKQYCEQKDFEYHKRRVKYNNNNIVCKCTYEYTKAAQYQPRKDKNSKKYCQ
ncbi:hypothetical protein RhiirA4_459601 [Rhizophagus irregularis]|uniref:Uncharacterized protein n=1 Tax=Rhizophagus irregularis TaxID=588596 RepID=A0A2I1GEP8_9GLOM|nr:hypothetical protein RhiirA4_459601 [Rhizophagus irregularis]